MKKFVLIGAAIAAALMSAVGSASANETINLCTGGEKGIYYPAGTIIKNALKGTGVDVNVVLSKGSVENVDRTFNVATGEDRACDAFISQPDTVAQAKNKNSSMPVMQLSPLHREYLQVLCGVDSGIDDLEDVAGSKEYTVNIGPVGSGTWALWQNFIAEDKSYDTVPVKTETATRALSAVANGDTTCMLITSGLKDGDMQNANDNYSDRVALVEATDWDFNDAKDIKGKPLYEFVDIPRTYKNLQGFWGGSRETVSWNAYVYANTERMDDATLDKFIDGVNRASKLIRQQYGE